MHRFRLLLATAASVVLLLTVSGVSRSSRATGVRRQTDGHLLHADGRH